MELGLQRHEFRLEGQPDGVGWIRLGTKDSDTSHTVSANLAATANALGDEVDRLHYWARRRSVFLVTPSKRDADRRILVAMTKPAAPKRHLPTSPFKAPVISAPKHFAVGDQVTHDMYGLGRVIGIEEGIAALVDFGSTQERILSPYAKMTKL